MVKIKKIKAIEILDSRGNPTIETSIEIENGLVAKASVPSGASVGKHEALELRDQDKKRYNGLGVLKAVDKVNHEISSVLKGADVTLQQDLDEKMIKADNTKNKSNFGANAILSVSLAAARAGAMASKMFLYQYLEKTYGFENLREFPIPMMNVFNGGKHADTNLDFQEFMIVPIKNVDIKEKIRIGAETFHKLGEILSAKGYDIDVGNEGGYAPDIGHTIDAIEMIIQAIKEAGFRPGDEVALAMDAGASVLYNKKNQEYVIELEESHLKAIEMIELYKSWKKKYPFISIEDGLAEDDFDNWKLLNEEMGREIMLVGDDLFVTNIDRLKKGIDEKLANAVLIKPNQVGTLSEAVECIRLAKENDYKVVVSHRSGETKDNFISDLAFATNADFIKAGSLCRGERLSKYNRLIEIYEEL